MNVKNLRQMFERSSVKQNEQSPKQTVPNRPKAPTQPIIKPPQVSFSYNQAPPPPISHATDNKNFLEELNKKLGRQSTSALKPEVQSLPDQSPYRTPQPMTKQQSQLNIDDIITGMENYESKQEEINARFGINEKYPSRSRQKTMFENTMTASGHKGNSSFTDMLQNMLSSLNRKKEEIPQPAESPKTAKKQTSKITNKLQYDQSYKTSIAKTKRIDFVLSVIFRDKDYQNIGQGMLKPEQLRPSTIPQERESDTKEAEVETRKMEVKPKHRDSQLKVEQIVQKKHKDNEEVTISSTAKRPSMVSNNFLNELTLKLAKKSMGQTDNKTPSVSPGIIHVESISSVRIEQELKAEEEGLAPRQKKRARTRENFDDF